MIKGVYMKFQFFTLVAFVLAINTAFAGGPLNKTSSDGQFKLIRGSDGKIIKLYLDNDGTWKDVRLKNPNGNAAKLRSTNASTAELENEMKKIAEFLKSKPVKIGAAAAVVTLTAAGYLKISESTEELKNSSPVEIQDKTQADPELEHRVLWEGKQQAAEADMQEKESAAQK